MPERKRQHLYPNEYTKNTKSVQFAMFLQAYSTQDPYSIQDFFKNFNQCFMLVALPSVHNMYRLRFTHKQI